MTATLPSDLRDVFARCTVAELVTIDGRGRPVAHSVVPAYRPGGPCIDVADGAPEVGDPHVALLFADDGPMVLVQGTAQVQDVLHVRPERVYAWASGDPDAEPRLFDAHLEEVRSGHNEEPEVSHAGPEGGAALWDERLDGLDSALLACVGPDGFPFAVRVPVHADRAAGLVRIGADPVGAPIEPGVGCLRAAELRVRGDLEEEQGGWVLRPHAMVGAAER